MISYDGVDDVEYDDNSILTQVTIVTITGFVSWNRSVIVEAMLSSCSLRAWLTRIIVKYS